MKPILFAATLIFSAHASADDHFTVDVPQLQKEGKTVIMTLVETLTGELKKAKAEGGAPAAIKVCNLKALPLTQSVSENSGWEIGRTSLQLRNQKNAPDECEKAILEQFANKARQGANLKTLGFSQVVVEENGQKVFRMMKAIPVGEQCLACHGTKLKPELKNKIEMLYPEDRAQGFEQGDLRGAFTLKKYL